MLFLPDVDPICTGLHLTVVADAGSTSSMPLDMVVFIYLVPVFHIVMRVSHQVLLFEQYILEFLTLPRCIVYTL